MTTLKRLFILAILTLPFHGAIKAQEVVKNLPSFDNKQLHFGFTLGTNYMNFTTTHTELTDPVNGGIWYTDLPNLSPGFHVGIISSLRLNNYFNLRFIPSISFGQRNMHFVRYDQDFGDTDNTHISYVKSTFIETPLLFKYKALRDGNARPYLIAGPSARIDLSRSKSESIRLQPLDAYFEFGIGSDFYLNYFRLGVEVRFAIGLSDILDHSHLGTDGQKEPYTDAIERLTSRLFIISFNFE